MFSLRKPGAESIRRFLAAQAKLDFSYAAIGATANQLPPGFVVDRTRIKLGEGERVFQSAKAALQRWRQYDLAWLSDSSPNAETIWPGIGSSDAQVCTLNCITKGAQLGRQKRR